MQTDPIGYTDDYNLYAYVGNDPANGVDPTGTEKIEGTTLLGNNDSVIRIGGTAPSSIEMSGAVSADGASSGQAAPSGEQPGIKLQLSEDLTRPDVRAIAHELAQDYKTIVGVVVPVVSLAGLAGKETIKAGLIAATLLGPNPGKTGITLQPTRQMVNVIQRVEKVKSDAGMKLKDVAGAKPD